MLTISSEVKELFRKDNLGGEETRRKWKLRFYDSEIQLLFPEDTLFPSDDLFPVDQEPIYVIDNSQMVTESVVLTESLCESEDLTFGECNAAQFEVTVADVLLDLTGKEFMVTVEIGDYEMAMGIYAVDSFIRQADHRLKKITAYDRMRKFHTDVASWYQELVFPMTLKQFRDSLCAYIGIAQIGVELPLDEMIVTKAIDPEQLSGMAVLRAICEINGCFGHIDKTGRLRYKFLPVSGLYPSDTLFPDDDLYPSEMSKDESETLSHYKQSETTYEDFVVTPIDRIQIRQEEGDIGILYGDGGNTYVIQGNFLAYGKSSDELLNMAAAIYENISGRIYRPCKIATTAMPWVEVGDGLICYTTDDVIETYCMKRTLKGIQGMMDTYEATGSIELEENFGIHTQIIQLEGKTAVIKKNVDEVSVRLTDLKEFAEAQFKVVADEILAEVKRASEAEASLKIRADEIAVSVTDLADETSAQIKLLSDSITLKVNVGDVSNQLSIETDGIDIRGNRFSWDATNSRMTKEGDLFCRNATLSGIVTAYEGGKIGPFDITKNGLRATNDNVRVEFGGFFVSGGQAYIGCVMVSNDGIDMGVLSGNGRAGTWDSDGIIKTTEIYIADPWWNGWSMTRTIKALWNKVFSGGGCNGDCPSDGECDDAGCDYQELVDDIGGC